jgi:hypothetical protein
VTRICLAGAVSPLTPVPSDPEQLEAWLAQLGASRLDAFHELDTNHTIELPAPPRQPRALTLKLSLKRTKPPVWRRLVVAGDTTLDQLHEVLQSAMGWSDSHLHRFFPHDSRQGDYFLTDYDIEEGDDGTPEEETRLDQLLREPGDRIFYEYDFGDGWDHELRLERIDALGDDPRPRCTGGRLACPPEDVGGVGGYAAVAGWVRAGRPSDDLPEPFDSYESAVDWLPPDWDPDAFDVEEADLLLSATSMSGALLEQLRPEVLGSLTRLTPRTVPMVSEWLAAAFRTSLADQDLVELAAPYQRLLEIIGGGVKLTTSRYLPPEVVRDLVPALGIDPILAGTASSESRVTPLADFRKVVQQVGLIHSQHGLLMPTAAGIQYGDDPEGLWAHVAARLPVGRGELQRDSGSYTLLALAGGVSSHDVYDAVHALCVDAGWEHAPGEPIAREAINRLVWPTLVALAGASWNSHRNVPDWVPAAAATALFAGRLT